MATTAKESNLSLLEMFNKIGFNLIELEDWNCCGSTSAHNIDSELALDLAVRNLFLAPPDRPLLVACPNCILRLRHAHLELKQDDLKRRKYEKEWGTTYNTD
jgi:heterodisulfide reductase subunit B